MPQCDNAATGYCAAVRLPPRGIRCWHCLLLPLVIGHSLFDILRFGRLESQFLLFPRCTSSCFNVALQHCRIGAFPIPIPLPSGLSCYEASRRLTAAKWWLNIACRTHPAPAHASAQVRALDAICCCGQGQAAAKWWLNRDCHNATMPQCHNATMPQCHNATMRQCDNATMRQCSNGRPCGS